ncbi:vegetative cell wall protein gp1 [Purpureocillium lavendulum]|uniref:Vegetative cell wall protein gp1 n=1 Tax=Purpureocillium lavendulum TaxID=1247861 RepID=A0AB34FQE0_9HYPO|nr:vegetative cell wall protein gp1 [Purpureocillium lavendulum]
MDFLLGRKPNKGRLKLKRSSLKDPPNMYYNAAPPALPNRPATSAGNPAVLHPRTHPEGPWGNPAAAYSQQQLVPEVGHQRHPANPSGPSPWTMTTAPPPAAAFQQWPVRGANQEYYNSGWGHDRNETHYERGQNVYAYPGQWTTSMVHLPSEGPQDSIATRRTDMGDRFDDLMTHIDRDEYTGDEAELFLLQPQLPPRRTDVEASPPGLERASSEDQSRGFTSREKKARKGSSDSDTRRLNTSDVTAAVISGNYFSKVDLYANSRLPMDLPGFAVYMPTWPLLCLAARHSQRAYYKPRGADRLTHVPADWLSGTKAMTISSVPADHAGAVVLAIRGSASFADWAVNLRADPAPPAGFLDDDCGNACHAGFLSAARSMVRPVARRLRRLLDEDPRRAGYSLVLTGHSAGGAVAALLYAHMLARSAAARSELTSLAGAFKRVHCVTFGAPPVALLPLRKPDDRPDLRKSLFLSFVNEGDPVARADKEYVKSLLEVLARPPPPPPPPLPSVAASRREQQRGSRDKSGRRSRATRASAPVWPVPPVTLCNAGRLVVLRSGNPRTSPTDRKTVKERLAEGVVAVTCTPEQIGRVIWGDPVCHLMSLYAARIEVLAVGAVTANRR